MQIIQAPSELNPPPSKICLAVGFFDGVHLGHQLVIRQALADAQQHQAHSLVLTFDRHPNSVIAPSKNPPLIYPLPLKLRSIGRLGVQTVLLLRFDKAFSRQSGEAFIRSLVKSFPGIASISVGSQFEFGSQRSGNVPLLERWGRELKFAVNGLPPLSVDGQVVSSTRIRKLIGQGQLRAASRMLGQPYALAGPVVPGDQLGQRLGFPTANLDTAGLVIPPAGVYAVRAQVHQTSHPAVLNIGWRPTLRQSEPQLRVEAHLLDFHQDLYGAELELILVQKLRDEQKFPSMEALQRQIRQDIIMARKCLIATC